MPIQPALELLGVSLEELRRSRAGDFTPPAFGAEAPWIMQLLRDTGELHSLSMLRSRNNGPDAAVEFRFVKDAAGPGRHVSTLRLVPSEPDRLVAPGQPPPSASRWPI